MGQLFLSPVEGTETAEQENLLGEFNIYCALSWTWWLLATVSNRDLIRLLEQSFCSKCIINGAPGKKKKKKETTWTKIETVNVWEQLFLHCGQRSRSVPATKVSISLWYHMMKLTQTCWNYRQIDWWWAKGFLMISDSLTNALMIIKAGYLTLLLCSRWCCWKHLWGRRTPA